LGKRAYIQCRGEGPVHVPELRLRQWIVDSGVMAKSLAAAMALSGTFEEVLAGRVWKLGRRRLAGRFRDVFLSMAPDGERAKIAEITTRHLTTRDGILLAVQLHQQDGWGRLTAFDVT
jgi:hypothetical protein